ncbi:MAG TPA: M20/M25/M40 family metallo-hydrolase, partial [Skermanella sp.]|nr:M20/M25/M40 family metallo-hydrolase [Skermanella sp.]
MLPVEPVLAHLDRDFDQAVERLRDLLRIRSVSTDPAYKDETRQAAQWLADQLTGMGFEASLRDTPGHPMVVAHHPGPADATGPHVLYYGHYDVQPPEPLELWNSPPFEPTIVDAKHGKRVVARGAVDDKGQVMTFIEAFRAWHAVHGTLPGRITVLLEGEEETGSPNLVPFLEANREELAADICVVTDTNSWNIETPAITYMLRGMLYLEVTLHGPSHDLHSGMYGGAVLNPINALTRILGQIHDDQGRVQFPGFYDDVQPLSDAEREQWRSLGFDEAGFLAGVGLKTPRGEEGWSSLERIWARPTCDINGIWGGYTGAGSKTVIPAQASAKFSCRLVAGQDPKKILAGIKE